MIDHRVAHSIHRAAKLLEVIALSQGMADRQLGVQEQIDRLTELREELWPKGLHSEHRRNPMNHMGRSRA